MKMDRNIEQYLKDCQLVPLFSQYANSKKNQKQNKKPTTLPFNTYQIR